MKNDDKYSIPYPKYNESLPLLSVHIYDLKTGKTIHIPRSTQHVFIYHIVWYCDTCLAIVYGNRKRNSSVIQLYEIVNEKIISKSKYLEETRKGSLLSRFLKPYFYASGTYAYIIRFNQLNTDKSKSKAFPYVVRIYFNQTVCFISIDRQQILFCFVSSIHKLMRNHRKIFMQMKLFMLIDLDKFIL